MVVTEMATPTPELARVSNASIPAIPATNATTSVSLPMVVRPVKTPDAWMLYPDGMNPSWCWMNVDAAAAPPAAAIPSASVSSARPASCTWRPTMPTAMAVIGSRSGLTAIAPTIRIPLLSITP